MNGALQRLSQPLAQRFGGSLALSRAGVRSYAADAHGEVKVNFWEAPLSIPKWKEEQIVLLVLGSWGIVIYTAMKTFGGKKDQPEPQAGPGVAPAQQH